MMTRLGLTAACLLLPLLAFTPASNQPAMAGNQSDNNARIVVAEYMRAVPAGAAGHCTRVCVKARDMGSKAEPVCVQWKKVC